MNWCKVFSCLCIPETFTLVNRGICLKTAGKLEDNIGWESAQWGDENSRYFLSSDIFQTGLRRFFKPGKHFPFK